MGMEDAPVHGTESEWASVLKAFAHPVRLMILDELLRNPRCVTAIHEILDVRQPNISQHLTVLRNCGVVVSRQDGAYRCYYLPRPGLVQAVFDALSGDWPVVSHEDISRQFRKALSLRLGETETE
jgi:ArsR family transcriptional regulator